MKPVVSIHNKDTVVSLEGPDFLFIYFPQKYSAQGERKGEERERKYISKVGAQ